MSDWRQELDSIFEGRARAARAEQENAEFESFLDSVALPALQELAQEFNSRHEMDARVRRTAGAVTITVYGDGVEEINFRVLKHYCQTGILPTAEVRVNRGAYQAKYESMFKSEDIDYKISDVTKDDVIACFIKYFRMVRDGGTSTTKA